MPRPAVPSATILLCVLAGVGNTDALAAQDLPPVGVVDQVEGSWVRDQDDARLNPGTLLYEGDTVSPEVPSPGSIEIVLFVGGARWRQACPPADPCAGSYRPRGPTDDGRGFWAFLSSFWKDGEQLPPILAGARSGGSNAPVHSFVQLRDGSVDLAPALMELPTGEIRLRLQAAPGGSLSGSGVSRGITVQWRPGADVPMDGLAPGLYLVSAIDASGSRLGGTSLLLAHPDGGGVRGARWTAARDAISGNLDLGPRAQASLLAHALYALDAQPN